MSKRKIIGKIIISLGLVSALYGLCFLVLYPNTPVSFMIFIGIVVVISFVIGTIRAYKMTMK
jgi:hypothetical protein